MCDNVIFYNHFQWDPILVGARKIKRTWMHFLKIQFLRRINAVGCLKKRHAPRCIHKIKAILSVLMNLRYMRLFNRLESSSDRFKNAKACTFDTVFSLLVKHGLSETSRLRRDMVRMETVLNEPLSAIVRTASGVAMNFSTFPWYLLTILDISKVVLPSNIN